jgi:hypothetical protein
MVDNYKGVGGQQNNQPRGHENRIRKKICVDYGGLEGRALRERDGLQSAPRPNENDKTPSLYRAKPHPNGHEKYDKWIQIGKLIAGVVLAAALTTLTTYLMYKAWWEKPAPTERERR